jgi:hypothetical protein
MSFSKGEVLTYTDDTAVAIGVAEFIAVKRCVDERHLRDRLRANYHREPGLGYCSGPPRVFAMTEEQGVTYSAVGPAALRISGFRGQRGGHAGWPDGTGQGEVR